MKLTGRMIGPVAYLLLASAQMSLAANGMNGEASAVKGPTAESALAAEKELGQAMRTNDPEGFCRLLDPDWAVVTGNGDIGAGDATGDGKMKESICAAIKAGTFTRKTYDMDLANARVRVYGDSATVTFKLALSGSFNHKPFSVNEVQTDVLKWEDGAWKCVLTHETIVKGTLRTE